jgi:DNA-binding MarR family transcriptional regulator
MADADTRAVLEHYPRIYFACHTRHVQDLPTGQVLSRHQASILSHLDEVDATSMTELAEHMGVTASTMSLAIKRLERQGFVHRVRDAGDRRVVQLRLSEAGVRVRDAQSVLDEERVAGVLGLLSPSDRLAALHGLALLARASSQFMRLESPRRAG